VTRANICTEIAKKEVTVISVILPAKVDVVRDSIKDLRECRESEELSARVEKMVTEVSLTGNLTTESAPRHKLLMETFRKIYGRRSASEIR